MPSAQLLCADLLQLASQTFPFGLPPDRKPAFSTLRTDMAKAQEGKGIRSGLPPAATILARPTAELNQPRLFRVQLQAELRQPYRQLPAVLFGLLAMLESQHEVVGVADDDDRPFRLTSSPLVGPQIQYIVQ